MTEIEVIHFTHAWQLQKVFIPIVFLIQINSMSTSNANVTVHRMIYTFGGLFWISVISTCTLLFENLKETLAPVNMAEMWMTFIVIGKLHFRSTSSPRVYTAILSGTFYSAVLKPHAPGSILGLPKILIFF